MQNVVSQLLQWRTSDPERITEVCLLLDKIQVETNFQVCFGNDCIEDIFIVYPLNGVSIKIRLVVREDEQFDISYRGLLNGALSSLQIDNAQVLIDTDILPRMNSGGSSSYHALDNLV